jgi:hypothetical protein
MNKQRGRDTGTLPDVCDDRIPSQTRALLEKRNQSGWVRRAVANVVVDAIGKALGRVHVVL